MLKDNIKIYRCHICDEILHPLEGAEIGKNIWFCDVCLDEKKDIINEIIKKIQKSNLQK